MRGFKGKMPCPTTATPVLREPAQSKCTWTCHKSHSRPKFTGNMPDYAIEMHTDMSQEPFYAKCIWKMPNANTATPSLCEPAQSKCTWTFHKSHFVRNLKGKCRKMPNANPATPVLCEPAQSKCTWTCHKSHVVWKFTGKMPDATDSTSIELRGLTLTIRTPQCGQVWRKIQEACHPKSARISTKNLLVLSLQHSRASQTCWFCQGRSARGLQMPKTSSSCS